MNNIIIALLIGIAAAIVDVVPMMIQKLDKYACISAFIHWVALGLIIPFVNWEITPWLKGLIIAEISTLSVMALVFAKEPKSIIPIVIFTAILGSLVGYFGSILIV